MSSLLSKVKYLFVWTLRFRCLSLFFFCFLLGGQAQLEERLLGGGGRPSAGCHLLPLGAPGRRAGDPDLRRQGRHGGVQHETRRGAKVVERKPVRLGWSGGLDLDYLDLDWWIGGWLKPRGTRQVGCWVVWTLTPAS